MSWSWEGLASTEPFFTLSSPQLSPQSCVKSGSTNRTFCITEITVRNQGCPTTVYPEINPEAAETPVGHNSPDAVTLQDPEKFAVCRLCPQKTFDGLSCGGGCELPAPVAQPQLFTSSFRRLFVKLQRSRGSPWSTS